ncbi:MAG: TRAP transporter substrate-binding protein [Syntrophomonadaceae bacterium]
MKETKCRCGRVKMPQVGRWIPRSCRMVLSVLLISILVVSSSGCSDQGGQDTVELKLAHFFPANHPAEKELIQPWAAAIEEATQGKVKIISYPNQTLLSADTIYEGVVTGVADIGLSCFAYTRGRFPVLEVLELPGIIYDNSKAASYVAWETIRQINPAEIQDTKLMMVLTTGSGDIFTREPVRNLADLKGKEIRATGLSARTLEILGATPVAMPQSDAYESLSKGVVNGNLGPVEVLKGWKQAEVTDYLTKTPFLYNTVFFVTMNLDKWNSLDAETQKIFEDANNQFFAEVASSLWDKQNEEALDWAVKEQGIEVISLSPEEQDLWIEKVKPVQEEYVAKMNQSGINGQEILDTVKKLATEFNQQFQ